MAIKIKKGSTMDQLPLTPLIDTVFNLLIFFLVASKFAEAEREMDLMLPDASEARPLTVKPRELFLNIDAEGRYYVTGKLLGLPELDAQLRQAWTNNPQVSAIIRADKRCRWQAVVAAMNACVKARIRDYRVTTRDHTEGGG
jgi:biopolymer transport protein ExbD